MIGRRVERDTLAVVNGRLGTVEEINVHPTRMGGATARPDVRVCTVSASGAAVAAGQPTRCARSTSGAGRRTHRVGNGARVDVDCGLGRTRPRPGHLSAGPRSRGTDRIRAHRATGRRARRSATRRHGLQGIVTGGERSLHRSPGDRPSLGDLLRPCGSSPWRRRGRGPNGQGVVVVPGWRFGDYLATMCGLIRRYGCAEPTVSLALLRLLHECAGALADDPARWAAIGDRLTSFWRTPPERPHKRPTFCPSPPPGRICSGEWHGIFPGSPGNRRPNPQLLLPEEMCRDPWSAVWSAVRRRIPFGPSASRAEAPVGCDLLIRLRPSHDRPDAKGGPSGGPGLFRPASHHPVRVEPRGRPC